jgi:periplasmic protein TonB
VNSEPPGPSWRIWLCAAFGALALHAGCVFALTRTPVDEDDDALGAQAIEVGIDFAAPKTLETDLPPGPEADASNAAPEVMEQQEKPKDTDLPKERPVESEQPDRVVSPEADKKPEEKKPDAAVQTAPSSASVASVAAAPAPLKVAKEAPTSAAPAQGIGDSARRAAQTWQRELVAYLNRHKRYPEGGERREARLVVGFRLDRRGHLVTMSVTKSSGDPAFDDAALAMLRRSDPLPAPPPLVADQGLTFTLPVVFQVKGRS